MLRKIRSILFDLTPRVYTLSECWLIRWSKWEWVIPFK